MDAFITTSGNTKLAIDEFGVKTDKTYEKYQSEKTIKLVVANVFIVFINCVSFFALKK